ncbi:MAG: hypothetical protein KAS36_10710 [Anaerolineales bacterium]|jgi:hypothetical protein|nr:hypothetical protein [Anaerolineales bacterium]|tara:strand:+ start:281 stop:610 length:330 start_codon:yes stop_codon:yes gene_type:complete
MASRRSNNPEEFVQDLLELVSQSIVANEHMNAAIIRLQEQQNSTSDDINQLLRLVRDGNGRPALISRLEALEREAVAAEKSSDMRWELFLVALPGVLAFIMELQSMTGA